VPRGGRSRAREFWCPVVSETVHIRLRRPASLSQPSGYFVQCDQLECQYVEANAPPCPLHLGLFSEDITAGEAARAARRRDAQD
jgi:hypothetical protein